MHWHAQAFNLLFAKLYLLALQTASSQFMYINTHTHSCLSRHSGVPPASSGNRRWEADSRFLLLLLLYCRHVLRYAHSAPPIPRWHCNHVLLQLLLLLLVLLLWRGLYRDWASHGLHCCQIT